MILEYGGERPADQCQIVRGVEMWHTSKDIGPFSTCMLHTNLKTRFEFGISHLVFLARYFHQMGLNLCGDFVTIDINITRLRIWRKF